MILSAASKTKTSSGELRFGQCLYNELIESHQKVAKEIRGTENDPFYSDDKIVNFFNYLITNVME
jgi:hypothetical protein